MGTLAFSDKLWRLAITRGNGKITNYLDSSTSRMWLMQGTEPSQVSIDDNTQTPSVKYVADQLAEFTLSGVTTGGPEDNQMNFAGEYAVVSTSGTVGWILIMGSPTSTTRSVITLTVTGVGGGGNIEMVNPSIVAGERLLLSSINLDYPNTEFTL